MFRRSFLINNGLRYPEASRHGEDFLFVTDILLTGAKYILTLRPGYFYTTRASGMSRTRIDYDGMVLQTLDLLADPRISNDPKLVRLVKQRARSVKRLASEGRVDDMLRRRDVSVALSVLSRDRYAIPYLLRTALRRLRDGMKR